MGVAAPEQLVITQTMAELTIEQSAGDRTRTVVYKLDGSESTNPAGRGETRSTSTWDGATLVTDGSQAVSTPRGEMTFETHETIALSDDGQTLVIERTRTTPRGENTSTLVFTLVPTS